MINKRLLGRTKNLINRAFQIVKTHTIPSLDNTELTFSNKGMQFEATTLFIDIRNTTELLNSHDKTTIAKLYSAFFANIVLIAKQNKGSVRSFNTDRALIFFESAKSDSYNNAVKTAMEIKFVLTNEESAVKIELEKYATIDFGIGIEHGKILCTKVGISGEDNNQNLVWIGDAVDKSSKLAHIAHSPSSIIISETVYKSLKGFNKYQGMNRTSTGKSLSIKLDMWEKKPFYTNGANQNIYVTSFSFEP